MNVSFITILLHHWKYDKFDKVIAKTSWVSFFSGHSADNLWVYSYIFCRYDVV